MHMSGCRATCDLGYLLVHPKMVETDMEVPPRMQKKLYVGPVMLCRINLAMETDIPFTLYLNIKPKNSKIIQSLQIQFKQ